MNIVLIKKDKKLLLSVACLLLLILTHALPSSSLGKWAGQDDIIITINHYLDHSETIASEDLTKLLELNTMISPLQSSQVGISLFIDVQIEIGQLLASFTHLLNKAIEVGVLAVSSIGLLKLMINLSETIAPWLFYIMLATGVIYGLVSSFTHNQGRYNEMAARAAKTTLLLFLVLHIFLPYSLYGSALLSKHIIAEQRTENSTALHHLHQHVATPHNKQSLKERAEHNVHSFEKIVLDLPHKVETIANYHTRQTTLSLFEYIILPLGLLLLSTWMLISIFRSALPPRS